MDLFIEVLLQIVVLLLSGPMHSLVRAVGSLFMPDSNEGVQAVIGCLMLFAILVICGCLFWVINTPFRFS